MRAHRMIAGAIVVFAGWLAIGSGVAAAAGTGASITAVEGQALANVVVDSFSTCTAPRANITIAWGDGATSGGTLVLGSGGSCVITGSHTYAEEGSYQVSVSYLDSVNGQQTTDHGSATVTDAPVAASAAGNLTATAGSSVNLVANWTDPAPEALASYSATIDWGDGTTSAGVIGSGTIAAGHTYANGGRFTIAITFHDEGGATATATAHATVSGCPTSGPSAAQAFHPTVTGLNARYVQALYHDILGRSPASSELAAATGALSQGATRSELALTLLDSSEYRARLVASDYQAYLHRAPAPSETSAFVALLGSHSDEAVGAQFLGSSEYFASRGHQSPDGFLSALYCDALTRPIDPAAETADEVALGSGASRTVLASTVLGSSEYRSLFIRGLYLHYLRRAPSSSDVAFWSSFLHSGGTDEELIAAIVSSSEYFADVNPAVADPAPLILKGNTLSTILTHNATLVLSVYRIQPAGHASAVLVRRPHTKLVGVVNFGFHRKGHVKLRWNRTVHNHRLGRGRYLLVLRAYVVHKPYHKPYLTRRLIGISDAVQIKIR